MKDRIYKIQAFTGAGCAGNAAMVNLVDSMPNTKNRQEIARNNNAPATVFAKFMGDSRFELHCHSPNTEIEYCGHGSLATAYLLFHLDQNCDFLELKLLNSELEARKLDSQLVEIKTPRFSLLPNSRFSIPSSLVPAASECLEEGEIDIFILKDADSVRNFKVPVGYEQQGGKYLAVTAQDKLRNEIISRYFPIASGVKEDSVTGSLHSRIAPYWSAQLGTDELAYVQASSAGGKLRCHVTDSAVFLIGTCKID